MIKTYIQKSETYHLLYTIVALAIVAIPFGLEANAGVVEYNRITHKKTIVQSTIVLTDECPFQGGGGSVMCFSGGIRVASCPRPVFIGKTYTRQDIEDRINTTYPVGSEVDSWIRDRDCWLDPPSADYIGWVAVTIILLGIILALTCTIAADFLTMYLRGELVVVAITVTQDTGNEEKRPKIRWGFV